MCHKDYPAKPLQYCICPVQGQVQLITCYLSRNVTACDTFYSTAEAQKYGCLPTCVCSIISFCLSGISKLEGGRGKSPFCHHAQGRCETTKSAGDSFIVRDCHMIQLLIQSFWIKGAPNVAQGHPSPFYFCADLRTASGC